MADLHDDYARFVRSIREFTQERTFIILVGICMVASIISWFRAEHAKDIATEASIRSQMQVDEIRDLKTEIELKLQQQQTQVNIYKIRANRLDAWLKAHGVPIEEIYDDAR